MLGPSSLGRYARYSDSHLTRLLAIKTLKERRGLKLADIRQTLLCMSDGEVIALADTARTDANQRTSALDYIRSLNQQSFKSPPDQAIGVTKPPPMKAPDPTTTSQTNMLKAQRAQQSQRQLPAAEILHRFQITPDVELSVRGIQTEQQLTRMKNIANELREILIGGINE
jgi:DNA-binding transcriptional MerR regulator